MAKTTPADAFQIASGADPIALKITLMVILVAGLLLLYAWAINSGFKGLTFGRDSLFTFLTLLLKGALLVMCVILFFIY